MSFCATSWPSVRRSHGWWCAALLAAATVAAPAAESAGGFQSYRLVRTRNIFDPERRAGRTAQASREPTDRPDLLTLTGTLVRPDKAFAFFTGSRSEYRQVLSVGAVIGGARIREITSAAVELEAEGQVLRLAVGRQLRRTGDEPWTVSGSTESTPEPSRRAAREEASADPASPPAESPGGAAASDVLKRLMERRQKE